MTGVEALGFAAALVWVLALLSFSLIGAAGLLGGTVVSVGINRIGRMGGGTAGT